MQKMNLDEMKEVNGGFLFCDFRKSCFTILYPTGMKVLESFNKGLSEWIFKMESINNLFESYKYRSIFFALTDSNQSLVTGFVRMFHKLCSWTKYKKMQLMFVVDILIDVKVF